MTTEKMYPELECIEITEEEQKHLQENARAEGRAEARIQYIKDKQQQLNVRLEHLSKLKHRWTIIKHVSEGLGAATTVICAILTIVATSGIITAPVLALATSGTGLMAPILQALTNKTFITKHRNRIKIKHKATKELIDKLFLSFDRAASDGQITNEEMKQIEKLLASHSTPAPLDQATLTQEQLKVLTELLSKLK